MVHASSLYEACDGLFVGYPLAVRAVGRSGSAHSMVLMQEDDGAARFYILTGDHGEGKPSYSLRPWGSPSGVDIGPGTGGAVSESLGGAIAHGVPVPRHGSLLGWDGGGTITAVIAVYAEYTPESPVPSWATMPRADIPETQWPPFADEPLLGHWFWDYHRAGRIISLDGLIAANPDVVFWANTRAILGSDCCAVAHDIRNSAGPTLQRGRYVYYQSLRAGKPVPSLTALLADSGKIDLAPRLQWSGRNERPAARR